MSTSFREYCVEPSSGMMRAPYQSCLSLLISIFQLPWPWLTLTICSFSAFFNFPCAAFILLIVFCFNLLRLLTISHFCLSPLMSTSLVAFTFYFAIFFEFEQLRPSNPSCFLQLLWLSSFSFSSLHRLSLVWQRFWCFLLPSPSHIILLSLAAR